MTTINRGSEWRKWDLHVHTPVTLCSEYGGINEETWEKYFKELDRLSKEKHIKVLGINDYIFIDGYEKVLEYKKSGGLKNIELILPVVELRLREFVGSKELSRLNYHIIFADEAFLKIEQIKTQFLSGLMGKGNLDVTNPNNYTWGGVITRETLIDLGNHIIESTPKEKRNNTSPIDVGFNNLNFEHSDILNLLGEGGKPNIFLQDKYFKAIGKAEWEDFRWESSPLEKKSIINSTHFIFSASPTVEQAIKGKESLVKQDVNSRLLHCSDAHSFPIDPNNTKPKELGHCYTWIKASPTFEGLKQIIYEPDERIRIQIEEPDSKKLDENIIDQLQFISNSKTKKFTSVPIYLNKNLNVIIGGKSSGKSILLYNLARTLLNTPELEKIFKEEKKENEYNFRIKSEENPIEDPSFNFEVKIKVPDVSQNRFDHVGKSILPTIKYIPQNYLIKLAEPEYYHKGESLNKIIRGLITEKEEFYQKYHSVFIKNVKEKDNIRHALIKRYLEIKDDIIGLNKELGTKDDKLTIEKIIKHNSERIIIYKEEIGLDPEQIAEYQKIQLELKALNTSELKIVKDLSIISDFNNKTFRTLNDIKTQKDTLLKNIENDLVKKDFEDKYEGFEKLLKLLQDYIKSYHIDSKSVEGQQYDSKTDSLFQTLIDDILKEKAEKEKGLVLFRKNEEIEKNIKQLEESNQLQQQNLDIILGIEARIKSKKQEILIKRKEIVKLYKDTYREYPSVIEHLEPRLKALKQDRLQITGRVKFNFPKFRKKMLEISHGGSKSYNKWGILNESLTRTAIYHPKNFIRELNEIFNDIEHDKYALLSKTSLEQALNVILDDYFYDYWEIEYKGDKLGKMSTGKASFVILMIIIGLSESKAPILIDQPEDNLDNRSITEDLVKYLREKKKERQIILVTHNANIVVNADAENIIVANQRGQSDNDQDSDCPYLFDYINGALEETFEKDNKVKSVLKSMGIKQHVTDILEGGKEAFKKREEKYGFD